MILLWAPRAPTKAALQARRPVLSLSQEENRVVVIRFGRDEDEQCMQMDEVRLGVGK